MHALLLVTLMMFQQVTHIGTQNQLEVDIPRIEATVLIDGDLSDLVWGQAALLSGFSQYQPVDGRPAAEPTEVYVWYSDTAIHFGIRATEVHGDVVRATQANRDNIASEDQIQVIIDTQNDNKIGYVFASNPFGVRSDGPRADQFGGGAGGGSASGGGSSTINFMDGNIDINPDYEYSSAGRLTANGYEVEISIPFKSLRYQDAKVQNWGLHVLRKVQHSGFQDSWAPAIRASSTFLGQSGTLRGLTNMKRGLVLDIVPTITSRFDGGENTKGDWEYDNTTEFGGDVKWGIRQNLTLNGTINPDFSQVEADIGQVVLNERFALFFPEKRPFFLENLELFDTPGQMIYTRRIAAPSVGAKLAGKIGGLNVGTILAADDQKYSASGTDSPIFGIVRLRKDLKGNNTAGAVLTTREDGGNYSRLAGADSRIYFGQKYYLALQGVASFSDAGSGATSGSFLEAAWDRTGRAWGYNYKLSGISRDFEAAAGFVNRTGIIAASAFNRVSFYGEEGAFLETWGGFGGFNRIWNYEDTGAGAIEGGESLFPSATLRGGWRLSGSITRNFYTYSPLAFSGYSVVDPNGPDVFFYPEMENDQFGGSVGVTTPTLQLLTASVNASWGETPLFAEAAPGRSSRYSVVVDLRPTSALRASLQVTHLTLERKLDDSQFSQEIIPRIKLEYQLSQAIFVRVIGQYSSRERAALEDRQGNPIQIGGTAVGATKTNDLRTDLLFSYRPNPGTLFYLGYGSTMDDVGQKRFEDLRRQTDGFFMKLTYLFRV